MRRSVAYRCGRRSIGARRARRRAAAAAARRRRTGATPDDDRERRRRIGAATISRSSSPTRTSRSSRSRTPTAAATTADLRAGRQGQQRVRRATTRRPSSRRRRDHQLRQELRQRATCTQSPVSVGDTREPVPRRRSAFAETYFTALGGHFGNTSTKTIAGRDARVRHVLGEGPRRHGRRRDRRARSARTSRARRLVLHRQADRRDARGREHRRRRQASRRASRVTEVRDADRLRLHAARDAETVPSITLPAGITLPPASRSRPFPAAADPQRLSSRLPRGTARAAGRAAPPRCGRAARSIAIISPGPALARARPPRACRRSRAPSASRTRWRGSRSAARRRPRRPSATRARAASVDEPSGPLRQNDAKSCSPTNGSAASRSARRSSGSATHHTNRSRNGSGTGRLRIV